MSAGKPLLFKVLDRGRWEAWKSTRLFLNKWTGKRAREALSHEPVWPILQDYLERSGSTGCAYGDYGLLYQTVRKLRPTEILECGTGTSTVVLAAALKQNEEEGGPRGRITSMEDQEKWYSLAKTLMPASLVPYVDFVLSPRHEYTWSIFRGVGYKDVPDRPYSFVFVDGPGATAPSDGAKTFNFDFINVVRKSQIPVTGMLDDRLSTLFVYQRIFGADKARYDLRTGMGLLGPCDSDDLLRFSKGSSAGFCFDLPFFSLPIVGGPRVDLRIERERK